MMWVRILVQYLLVVALVALLARLAAETNRAKRAFAPAMVVLLGILVLASGCGGGGGGAGIHNPGTASGTYTLTVTGNSGGVNHIQKLTLKVN
jgi:hypothetical protein